MGACCSHPARVEGNESLINEIKSVQPVNILVGDTDPECSYKMNQMILNHFPMAVIHLETTGYDTVNAFCKQPYDAVFLEVFLPVMDGIEACRIIRNMNSQTRIYAMSNYLTDVVEGRLVASGITDYTEKKTLDERKIRKWISHSLI